MKELYLEIFSNVSENGKCTVSLETAIVLFIYEYCQKPPLLITLVLRSDSGMRPEIEIKLPDVLFDVLEGDDDVESPANLCKLPVLVDGATCIAGLCAVLRRVVKIMDKMHPLLGFKQGCLYACAETSAWTRFCEIDIIATINDFLLRKNWNEDSIEIPVDVARFEAHLGQPVKTHNIQKQKQDLAKLNGHWSKNKARTPDSRLELIQDLEHTYAEGHKICLADMILLPCLWIIFKVVGAKSIETKLPLIRTWQDNLLSDKRIRKSIEFIRPMVDRFEGCHCVIPEVSKNNLIKKSEIKSSQARKHIYTNQEAIDRGLLLAKDIGKEIQMDKAVFGHEVNFDWSRIPIDLQLEGSQFPEKRLERKAQQLENLVKAVMKIAAEDDRIVDFCSGSGYLGLVLAYSLPRCTVILLENKEESLRRARDRANALQLSNVIFCQSNIDYFHGEFNIGVSLHACGVATDLVMEKCLNAKANFVCCPCCYGSIQENHMIGYPRSEKYRSSLLTLNDYLTLAHSSDQTHDEANHKTSQGMKCMVAIDVDRCLMAREAGYDVSLSTLEPPTCTPKNHLLVGVRPRSN